MADIIEKAWYQGTDGQAYVASCYYDKDPYRKPRGYYVSIDPVEVSECGNGVYSTTYHGATGDGELHLAAEVGRKSAKVAKEAVEAMWGIVNEYFEKRGKVARKCSVDELL